MSSSPLPRRKIGSRACDACKIRKVRCSEAPPCTRCMSIGIECTFNKRQATRGPRSLRAKTLAEIRAFQETERAQTPRRASAPSEAGPDSAQATTTDDGESRAPGTERATPVSSLIVRLCLYNQRLFPVWPIIVVEDIIGNLLQNPADNETYALANAVCAAIIAQLKLPFAGRTDDNDPATAATMAAECSRAKTSLRNSDDGPDMNLNMLRISFFQHIYHENMSPGGSKSLLFLREAITIAQIMGLHRKSTYISLPAEEQQMRRRIVWLLFVTERGVAMLHKLPTILTWQASFPALDGQGEHDEAHILPAFKKLVDLFWTFDQGGAFDLIHADDSSDTQRSSRLDFLQRRLEEMSSDEYGENEVQKADILVTKSWMQTVLWRASVQFSRSNMVHGQTALVVQPYRIVNDFLSHISQYSKTALEAHGPTIELKIFEIASALTDALATNLDLLRTSAGIEARPVDMLIQLQRLLASSRGGNKTLLTLLCARIAKVEGGGSPRLSTSPPALPREIEGDEDQAGDVYQRDDRDRRRISYPNYLDTVMLDYPLQLPMWPDARQEPSDNAKIDSGGNLGIMFTPLAHESWDGWTVDLSGMSQLPL
ncbi:hypothetical protein N0V93_005938 [Gnomoniopsis smithogilvyi]|uniref:Zn(2)-C6 fungal-type domain-containing protein n=1 Tax=Gnomoniopsis smithogilvyi TaxID=1191159 RepID=A0A9W9CXM0_9PEZI|nr:hypothetical protein N0V93_005938 [Gnomoniopsis smithogilvyi]